MLPPLGYGSMPGDCDDSLASINPVAVENCDGIDNNCDGITDPNYSANATTWYLDRDGDGYGSTSSQTACTAPAGYVRVSGDCNDGSSGSYPNAPESCDGVDHDCDGLTNESSSTNATTWYTDADGDGYGSNNSTSSQKACTQPAGTVANHTDCNDSDTTISPVAREVCDQSNTDEDCDGLADDFDSSVFYQVSYYRDDDADGYGDSNQSVTTCETPANYSQYSGDCDDVDAARFPGNPEICDTLDNDCDWVVNDTMLDGFEPNDSSAAVSLLNSGAPIGYGGAVTSVDVATTFHLSPDQDWFYWTTNDGAYSNQTPETTTRMKLVVSNPAGVPFTVTVEDLYYSETALQLSSAAVTSTTTITTSAAQRYETLWRMKIVPDTTAGWSLATCASTITFTIREY